VNEEFGDEQVSGSKYRKFAALIGGMAVLGLLQSISEKWEQ
jgi:hypothetical protein